MFKFYAPTFARQITQTQAQAGWMLCGIMLSMDSLNPIKIIAWSLGLKPSLFATPFVFMLISLFAGQASDIIYFSIRIFFTSIISIFFKKVDVIGTSNVPAEGPIIFTGNHANQFVDALQIITTCGHRVGWLIAQKSWDRPVPGFFARAMQCIPVTRPQGWTQQQGVGLRVTTNTLVSNHLRNKKDHKPVLDPLKLMPGLENNCTLTMLHWLGARVELFHSTGSCGIPSVVDSAVKRPANETIKAEGTVIHGTGTSFTQVLTEGDKIRFRGKSEQLKVKKIVNDRELLLAEAIPTEYAGMGTSEYDVLKYVDQGKVFNFVHNALATGKCLGIFPEGGSHDRTDLLPLKAGLAVIAFGTLEKHGVNVPVVPIGLNYFRGHRFRARAVVEYGPPIRISEELYELYKINKKEAYSQFLMQVEEGMRGCLVTAPDYDSLQLVYTARRLFQPDDVMPLPAQKQDMNRRFAEGYKILAQRHAENGMPEDAAQLKRRLEDYRQMLQTLGMRDYQVRTLESPNPLRATYTVVHMFVVLLLSSVPSLILNLPVGIVAGISAQQERKKALAGSVVKIAGRDVMMSKKIMISIVMVPLLWLFYAALLVLLTTWSLSTKILVMLCFPLFSYAGVIGTASGMVDLKDMKPLLNRLRPSSRKMMNKLPGIRRELQRDLRAFVKRVGPELGPIYTDPDLKWGDLFRMQKGGAAAAENIETMAANAAKVMGGYPSGTKKDD